ncbi:MAG: hypothetical protein JW778_04125 [Candidatus Altiarchaeota archaeon]|nr:hypothetical protein [Candidatus Altiarchaeota archaeon]
MDEFDSAAIEFMANLGRNHGLGELQSKVIGLLYIEPEEISLEEIAEKTGYSLASISNTMKMLEAFGMVQRIKKPRTKKVYFYMEKNLARLNIMKLNAVLNNFIKPNKDILPALIEKYRNKVRDEKSKKKLRIVENYYKQMLEFEEITENWIKDLGEIANKPR